MPYNKNIIEKLFLCKVVTIVVEGIDGSEKSTQLRLLENGSFQ